MFLPIRQPVKYCQFPIHSAIDECDYLLPVKCMIAVRFGSSDLLRRIDSKLTLP